ncbi:MAG: type II toxin-antitoxin system HicB family antitoxin [Pirellulales bacterium]
MSSATTPKYLIVIERAADGSYSAYAPDLPGCVSCGDTIDELKVMIQEAIDFHLEGMRATGLPIPEPSTTADYVSATVA